LNTLFWTHLTSLSILLKSLRINLKKKSNSVQKKMKKGEVPSHKKLKEEDTTFGLRSSSETFFAEKNIWLNDVKDWEISTQKDSLEETVRLNQVEFDGKKKVPLLVSEWVSINRTRLSGIQNKAPLKLRKKKGSDFKEKRYSKEEKLSLKKSYFKIKINKLDLFCLESNIYNNQSFIPEKTSFNQNTSRSLILNLKKGEGEENFKTRSPPVIGSFLKLYKRGFEFDFPIGKDKKKEKFLKTPKLKENIKSRNFKLNFLKQERIDEEIFSRMGFLKNEKVILKQFNPWGDINFFFRSNKKKSDKLSR